MLVVEEQEIKPIENLNFDSQHHYFHLIQRKNILLQNVTTNNRDDTEALTQLMRAIAHEKNEYLSKLKSEQEERIQQTLYTKHIKKPAVAMKNSAIHFAKADKIQLAFISGENPDFYIKNHLGLQWVKYQKSSLFRILTLLKAIDVPLLSTEQIEQLKTNIFGVLPSALTTTEILSVLLTNHHAPNYQFGDLLLNAKQQTSLRRKISLIRNYILKRKYLHHIQCRIQASLV